MNYNSVVITFTRDCLNYHLLQIKLQLIVKLTISCEMNYNPAVIYFTMICRNYHLLHIKSQLIAFQLTMHCKMRIELYRSD